MKVTFAVLIGLSAALAAAAEGKKVPDVLNFKMKTIDGKDADLSKYQGKVVLFVNVASKCGYTPQYKGLEALHDKYKGKGLAIIGVPANDFGAQEPGTDEEIKQFCSTKYGVTFDMLSKVSVKGDDITPLYKHLTTKSDAKFQGDIKWNFEKFLIAKDGRVVGRYGSKTKPDDKEFVEAVERELAK